MAPDGRVMSYAEMRAYCNTAEGQHLIDVLEAAERNGPDTELEQDEPGAG